MFIEYQLFISLLFIPIKEVKILTKSKDSPNNTYLGPSFLKLLDHLWKSNKKEFSPIKIHNIIKKIMSNNYNADDASIIIDCILNKLHEEINFNQEINNNNNDEDPFDNYNQDYIYKIFLIII